MGSCSPPTGQDPAIMGISDLPSCHQHQLSLPYQKREALMQGIQNELETLSPESQKSITSALDSFMNLPDKERRILINGIHAKCCSSQLLHVFSSVKELICIDFLAALPPELSYQILRYLDATSLCRVAQVSHLWRSLVDDDVLWYHLCDQHINKSCSKCGWSLPLLQRQGRLMQFQDPNPGELTDFWNSARKVEDLGSEAGVDSSFSSSTRPPPAEGYHGVNQMAAEFDPSWYTRQTRPWKEVYREWFTTELNWKNGMHTTGLLSADSMVRCLQIHGDYVATGSEDAKVRLFALEYLNPIRIFEGHTAGISALLLDGHKIISGSLDRTIKVWNWKTEECMLTFSGHDDAITALDLAGNTLVSSSKDTTIKLWKWGNTMTFKLAFTLRGHEATVNSVKLDMASRTLISASSDCYLRLWDLDTQQCIRVFESWESPTQVVFLSPQAEHSLLGLVGGHDGACDERVEGTRASYGSGFLDHPERPLPPLYALSGVSRMKIHLLNTASGAHLGAMPDGDEVIGAYAVDGMRVVSIVDYTAKVWDVVTGDWVRTLASDKGIASCVALTDSVMAIASFDWEGDVTISNFKGTV